MLKEVSGARGGQGFVTRACTNEDTDCSCGGVPAFGAHTNTVRNGGHLHGSFILEGLRDLSERQISKVLHNWSFGELKEGLFLLNAVVAGLFSSAEVGVSASKSAQSSDSSCS